MAGWHNTTFTSSYDWSKTVNFNDFVAAVKELTLISTGTASTIPAVPDYADITVSNIGNIGAADPAPSRSGKYQYSVGDMQAAIESAVTGRTWIDPRVTITGLTYPLSNAPFWQSTSDDEATYGPSLLKFAGCTDNFFDPLRPRYDWTRKRPARIATVLTAGVASNFDDTLKNPAYNSPSLGQVAWCTYDGLKYVYTNVAGTLTWVKAPDQTTAVSLLTGWGTQQPYDYYTPQIWTEMYKALNALYIVVANGSWSDTLGRHISGHAGGTDVPPLEPIAQSRCVTNWNATAEAAIGFNYPGEGTNYGDSYNLGVEVSGDALLSQERSRLIYTYDSRVKNAFAISRSVDVYGAPDANTNFVGSTNFDKLGRSIANQNVYGLLFSESYGTAATPHGTLYFPSTNTIPPWSSMADTTYTAPATGFTGGWSIPHTLIVLKFVKAYS